MQRHLGNHPATLTFHSRYGRSQNSECRKTKIIICNTNTYFVKILLERFHLNGPTTGCHAQTPNKLEPPKKVSSFTLGEQGLTVEKKD